MADLSDRERFQVNQLEDRAIRRTEQAANPETTNINDWIEAQTPTSTNINDSVGLVKSLQPEKGPAIMYTYLRDTHGAKTLGDALALIKAGEVDPKVAQFWMDDGYFSIVDAKALLTGYPNAEARLYDKTLQLVSIKSERPPNPK